MGVLKDFNLPGTNYEPDVEAIRESTIERFGLTEWKKIVLTNEIHGHLGIYSTLGAKMGLFAISVLGEGEEPEIISFAGTVPPVSCFNDGLQVSTGATLGHGLISISDESAKRTEALFCTNNRQFRLRLKPEYEDRIKADILQGVTAYGHSPEYWAYIRTLALKYWTEWDRNVIFESL